MGKYKLSGSISSITIKPGLAMMANQTGTNFFNAGIGAKDKYGLQGDTHIIKNTEWGAIAYLAESKYGRNGTEVKQNATTNTGGGSGDAYKSNTLQSTTGNVYGVFDMTGGIWEYVTGYINNANSSLNTYNKSVIDANDKYKNVYIKGTSDTYAGNYDANKGMKGDAIYETSTGSTGDLGPSSTGGLGWYKDESTVPYAAYPILCRGRLC